MGREEFLCDEALGFGDRDLDGAKEYVVRQVRVAAGAEDDAVGFELFEGAEQ